MTRTLIVAGFHRSGTSLAAQMLHSAGLFLGDDLLGAMPSNPYGHFEDREIVRFHDDLLHDNGLNWQVTNPFIPRVSGTRWRQLETIAKWRSIVHPLWGFKDPRASLFLGLWEHALSDPRYVIVYRHWSDSTYSLERRHSRELFDGIGPADTHRRFWEVPDLALRMWLAYNESLIDFAKERPDTCVLVSQEHLAEGAPLVAELNKRWGLRLDEAASLGVFDPSATSRRQRLQAVSNRALKKKVHNVWATLEELACPELAGKKV